MAEVAVERCSCIGTIHDIREWAAIQMCVFDSAPSTLILNGVVNEFTYVLSWNRSKLIFYFTILERMYQRPMSGGEIRKVVREVANIVIQD